MAEYVAAIARIDSMTDGLKGYNDRTTKLSAEYGGEYVIGGPILFGILVVKMIEIGLVTPPISLNCFVVNGVRPDISLETVFWVVGPFFVMD